MNIDHIYLFCLGVHFTTCLLNWCKMIVAFEGSYILEWLYLVFFNDWFAFLTCIYRFWGTIFLNKPLKISFAMVEFILSGTKSHFDLVISSHVAYVFSTKPVHAFCSFIKRLIWYFYTSVKKNVSSLENVSNSVSCFCTGNGVWRIIYQHRKWRVAIFWQFRNMFMKLKMFVKCNSKKVLLWNSF